MSTAVRTLYLDLLKRSLAGWTNADPPHQAPTVAGVLTTSFIPTFREFGRDVPVTAPTMIGLRRLDHLQWCVEEVIRADIPGDLIETGVWRGGACMLMRGVLKAWAVTDRRVWVADSFQGLPLASDEYPGNQVLKPHAGFLNVDADTVRDNFRRFGLLDDQVQFLEGWFKDTLPTAPFASLAVMRLDGDLYESTRDALVALYPKLSPGGFVVLDDYHLESCRAACGDYRDHHGITAAIEDIDGMGAYWRKP